MLKILLVWLVNAVALIAVAYLLPGISVASFVTALIAALVLGLVNGAIVYSIISRALAALLPDK